MSISITLFVRSASRLVHTAACPDPRPVANAYRWITSGKVHYTCVESYNLTQGTGELTCGESDKAWLGLIPVCDSHIFYSSCVLKQASRKPRSERVDIIERGNSATRSITTNAGSVKSLGARAYKDGKQQTGV
ncbi:hypothetical protein PoB_005519500 [Plakobranchus ocellatus]|uniref:Sushi domain-containing protein n=1 Tax=Plakobranchus ocellatus TaxID=259542 RepID=A0AAV4C7K2_9GAST|nr:hypothetical protein PoB_005519500 [Plakobranchus ocellatus]